MRNVLGLLQIKQMPVVCLAKKMTDSQPRLSRTLDKLGYVRFTSAPISFATRYQSREKELRTYNNSHYM